jgi:hypothetical protein
MNIINFLFQIQLFQTTFGKKEKWGSRSDLQAKLENRTRETFWGPRFTPILPQLEPAGIEAVSEPIRFVNSDDLQKFGWHDILHATVPRDYQVRAFIDVLLSDVVLVMPTGSGKTLVASMVLARMCRENGKRTGLFVVDRIPLVFQQAAAIRSNTGLKVIGLCSENITRLKINQVWVKTFLNIIFLLFCCFG